MVDEVGCLLRQQQQKHARRGGVLGWIGNETRIWKKATVEESGMTAAMEGVVKLPPAPPAPKGEERPAVAGVVRVKPRAPGLGL